MRGAAVLAIAASGVGLWGVAVPAQAQAGSELAQRAAALRAAWAQHPHPGSATEPALTAGKVLTPAVNVLVAPGQPRVALTIRSGSVGASLVSVTITSPDGMHSVSSIDPLPPYPLPPNRQVFDIQVQSPFSGGGFGVYTEPGNWTVTGVSIDANDGTLIQYTASQLAALFSGTTIAVTNDGSPDTTPPAVGTGKILTPTISLAGPSPYFAALLGVADKGSGVQSVSLGFTAPGGAFGYGASSALSSPVTKGKVLLSSAFAASAPTGTYTVASYAVCDVAQNCTSDSNPADIMAVFGTTTFQVTD